jgi:hypothetical protein
VLHDQYGVSNLSNTAVATVECALSGVCEDFPCSVKNAWVFVYDRSTTANVSCTMRQTDYRGVVVWQQTLSSTGGGPGTEAIQLFFGSAPPNPASGAFYLSMRCSLPRKQSGWSSAVTGINVYFTP